MDDYIIFGSGILFKRYILRIKKYVNVLACIDNDRTKQGSLIEGIPVHSIDELCNFNYKKIILLVNPLNAFAIKKQLSYLNIDENKIQFYEDFFVEVSGKNYEIFNPSSEIQTVDKCKICIISVELKYNGGEIACWNLAKVLVLAGYDVTIVSYGASKNILKEITESGIKVVIYPAVWNLTDDTLSFFDYFDYVIVNTFLMIDCAIKISKIKKIMLWLHDPSDKYASGYKNTLTLHPEYKNCSFDNISIYAVSTVAKRNFHYYYPDVECGILPCSLPDYVDTGGCKKQDKLIFALIAGFSPLKAQKDFLLAASEIEKKYPYMVEFWLMGNIGSSDYSKEVVNLAKKMTSVKILGLKTQEEIKSLYKEISVVVCPSYEETLSIVTVEGFMNYKACIISEETGASVYVSHLENGLKCKAGNIDSIEECMEWCLSNRDKLPEIGKNARKIYDENFSMEIQKRNIMKIMKKDRINLTGGGQKYSVIYFPAFFNAVSCNREAA